MQLIKMKDLRAKLGGRSRSSIYADVANDVLPKPIKLGRVNYWDVAEVESKLKEAKE